jgi:death-on-curing family protein
MTTATFPPPNILISTGMCEIIYETLRENLEKKVIILGDPLPPLSHRLADRLESLLGSIEMRVQYHSYDIVDVAAMYFAWIAKDHAFGNGNKRMSVLITDGFLRLHGYRFTRRFQVLHDVALMIAKDKNAPRDEVVETLTPLFRDIIIETT